MWTLVVAALVAPPPLGDFPAAVAPTDGSTAPANASFFAVGDPAPTPDQVGIVVTVNGTAGPALGFSRLGCCALIAETDAPLPLGAAVSATVSSAAGDRTTSFTVGAADTTRPTLSVAPQVVFDAPSDDGTAYEIVIGTEAADDTEPVLLIAEQDGSVVGTSAVGFLLTARIPGVPSPGELCVDVSAMDVAGNVTLPAQGVCVTIEDEEPPPDGGSGGKKRKDDGGCATAPGAMSPIAALFAALSFFHEARKRRGGARGLRR